LISSIIEVLVEVSLSMQERDACDGDSHVCGRSQRVSGQNTKSSGVSRDVGLQRNLHREISRTERVSDESHRFSGASPDALLPEGIQAHSYMLDLCRQPDCELHHRTR
jgi:hypothetical protein